MMIARALPAGFVRSFALLGGAVMTIAATARIAMPIVATSDLASVATLVGGSGLIAWAAARIALAERLSPAQAFAAGLTLPVSIAFLLPPRALRAANDNQPFSGSWPQFISE